MNEQHKQGATENSTQRGAKKKLRGFELHTKGVKISVCNKYSCHTTDEQPPNKHLT